METLKLKRYAQFARRGLLDQVSTKLKLVLALDSAARREHAEGVKKLEDAIQTQSKEHVIDRVAYTWFNRFCALRFMDVNRYNRVNIVSPANPGQFQPEILAEAKMGHIDKEMVNDKIQQKIFDLLNGKAPSRDPQGEAYRLLVVAVCNFWNLAMPFLFQRIDDYTELLMPDDLLSGNSILAYTREAMTPNACEDVEVIGWLYQYYISEKKDEVFDGLKKNKKIAPENIPAATQLFTPHWIVRYLVENSLGRLWLLNRPDSKLMQKMDYYIKPEQVETDFLRLEKPEDIKICDPACGSGHMLTYAFDLLYAIYEEEGYEPAEIPEKILIHNLYGIEIDERAGELAAFALTMKARAKQRRFFNKRIKPNICVLENIDFDEDELNSYMGFIGRDLFTAPLQTTLQQFEEADNFGALIRPSVMDVDSLMESLAAKNIMGQLFLSQTHQKVLQALQQADYLSPKYHVVIANPPYMGGKGMNGRLGAWAKENYPNSKSDLFAMFIERGVELVPMYGYSAMVTMQSWMFLSSYETLRIKLMDQTSIESMAHMANMVMGIAFGTAATVWKKNGNSDTKGVYCYVEYEDIGKNNKPILFPPHNERNQKVSTCGWFFRSSGSDFKKIPGSPIAYWLSDKFLEAFAENKALSEVAEPRQGLATADNNQFMRLWSEVSIKNMNSSASGLQDALDSGTKWFPYNKGGDFRRWYGNQEFVVNWENDGNEIRSFGVTEKNSKPRSRAQNTEYYFKPSVSWSLISSAAPAFRFFPQGFIFDVSGMSLFTKSKAQGKFLLGLLNSSVATESLKVLAPTINFQVGDIKRIPVPDVHDENVIKDVAALIDIAREDWDNRETSWNFKSLPLVRNHKNGTLQQTYSAYRTYCVQQSLQAQALETANNTHFIDIFGLENEIETQVELKQISLDMNAVFRYPDKTDIERAELTCVDDVCELISYAVGCMFGRYSLDKSGLILANQGDTIKDYQQQIPKPRFMPDDNNVIPLLDGDWFTDDITDRFRQFLRVAFGDEHYEDNLQFIEKALGKNGKERDIRDYFLKDFYTDHVKRYKKRPIYWLFSSPKGSFNALMYMHRYRPDTVSVVLNDYLREFRTKLTTHKKHLEILSISASATPSEKTKALKEIEKTAKMIIELEDYERDVLYPLATEQIAIDLDDGVKANYPKFGAALKRIVGLDVIDD